MLVINKTKNNKIHEIARSFMKIHVLYVLLICRLHVCNYMYVHRYSIQSDIMLSYNMNHMIICELLCRILIIMLFVTSNLIWIMYDRPFSMFFNRLIWGDHFHIGLSLIVHFEKHVIVKVDGQ